MKWILSDTGFNTGKFNMEYDIDLARNCNEGEAVLRFYGWRPYAVSLGANQKYEDIDLQMTTADCIDVVKRPTGGRAILHSDEITYSVIMPANAGYSATEIYRKISLALVAGLRKYDIRLSDVELESVQPDFAKLLKEPSGIACFASTARSEVKFRGKKLIGSAQRKMNNAILQHGSLLCGPHHLNIIKYLNLPQSWIESIREDLYCRTTDIYSILNEPVDYIRLTGCLIDGFESEWGIKFC